MKSYGQFIDKSIALDESIVGRYFDSSRFGPGGNKNVTTGLKPNVPTVRQQQKTKPNNPTKPPLRATSQRPQRPINNDNKKGRQAVRNIAQKVVAKASDPQVRSTLSGLNQIRKNLPTAADFAPTSQSGLGLGGTLKGRSFSSLNKFGNRNKFEPNEIVKRKGLGDNKVSQVIRRGRKLGPDGEPINEPKDTSFKGKAKNFLKRKLGITDKVDKPEKPDEPMGANRVTTTGPKPDDSGSKVTTGKGKPNPSSGGAEAKTPKSTATSGGKSKGADSVSVNVSDKKPLRRFTKKPEAPDKKIRVDEPKTDPSRLNKVKGFPDKPEPKQENIPGIKTEKKPEPQKKPRKKRTPEEIAASNKKRAETKARKKEEASKKSGQGTIPGLEDRNQSRKDTVEKTKVKITGSKSPEITGTKTDKVTSSDNVDKTSKPVEKPVEKKSNEISGITDAREKKPAGKKRGPKKGSTNVRTLARQNREKKQQETQAKERIAAAVKKQEEQDKKNPIEQAKQDSKTSTALTGSTLERNRKELAKMLNLGSGSSSGKKKNTQLKDMSDDELARQEQDSDTGKYRRNATTTKKYNPNAKKSTEKKNVKKSYKTTNKKKETTKNEEFSHWREEFLWEVDKKYPDKVKEIKPMTGKNTITINPEDETSKYKRGY